MKINISEAGTKDYYNEFLFINHNYKKIHSNPKTKLKKLTSSAFMYLIISLIIFIIFLIWYLTSNTTLYFIITIFFFLLIMLSIAYICLINNKINLLIKTSSPTEFEITNNEVIVKNNNQEYKLEFPTIKNIIIGNYTISFIPHNITQKIIITRIEYKNEIIKTLKKYNKDYLIIE